MKICLYGASSPDINPAYIDAVFELGAKLASRGHSMVYGGGALGLMGAAARGVVSKGGILTGISPSFLNVDGILFENCTEFIFTPDMRERKKLMEESADAFIMVPGGIGTYEEFFEIFTLKQLNRHAKAIAVFNVLGYFDVLEEMLRHTAAEKFMQDNCLELYKVFDNADLLLDYLEDYKAVISDSVIYKDYINND